MLNRRLFEVLSTVLPRKKKSLARQGKFIHREVTPVSLTLISSSLRKRTIVPLLRRIVWNFSISPFMPSEKIQTIPVTIYRNNHSLTYLQNLLTFSSRCSSSSSSILRNKLNFGKSGRETISDSIKPRHQSEARGSSSSKEEFAETVLALNSCQLEGGPVLTRRGKTRRRE